jgi:ribosomal-protein-alanine N-acetyltransferase
MMAVMRASEPDGAVTDRIELRPVPLALARALADPAAGNPGSLPWASGYPLAGSRLAARSLVRQAEAAGAGDSAQWGMYQMILRETGEVIGDIGFHGPPDESGTVEIGYGIVEQVRGRGLAGESAVAICRLAWSSRDVTRIIARTDDGNAASAGVLRHAGFRAGGVTDGLRTFALDRPQPQSPGGTVSTAT